MLALVPVDGSSIGNQLLLERVKSQFSQLSENAFWAARDEMIEKGLLQTGRVWGLYAVIAVSCQQSG
ncbi:hypothetical protein [Pseudomonas aeruginosa]|uniref:hypothetical protein n=1 Tax=Pseudomonas aeruginosa TaxID=287 RepID=UPI0024C021D5|nr:hypothetical protein [Pseudomonas aeruginosa]WHV79596.1 hypothetical protein M2I96_12270 [Pseudomonas aeruginosa]